MQAGVRRAGGDSNEGQTGGGDGVGSPLAAFAARLRMPPFLQGDNPCRRRRVPGTRLPSPPRLQLRPGRRRTQHTPHVQGPIAPALRIRDSGGERGEGHAHTCVTAGWGTVGPREGSCAAATAGARAPAGDCGARGKSERTPEPRAGKGDVRTAAPGGEGGSLPTYPGRGRPQTQAQNRRCQPAAVGKGGVAEGRRVPCVMDAATASRSEATPLASKE